MMLILSMRNNKEKKKIYYKIIHFYLVFKIINIEIVQLLLDNINKNDIF